MVDWAGFEPAAKWYRVAARQAVLQDTAAGVAERLAGLRGLMILGGSMKAIKREQHSG